MADLSLLDALIILFLLYRISRSRSQALGESIHGLISVLLIAALLLGLRLASQLRGVLSEIAGLFDVVPGLGSKLLIIIAAWYLMRLIRDRLGEWIEAATPANAQPRLTLLSETVRSVLLVLVFLWLAEPFLDDDPSGSPYSVQMVRAGDAWLGRRVQSPQ